MGESFMLVFALLICCLAVTSAASLAAVVPPRIRSLRLSSRLGYQMESRCCSIKTQIL